jgi:hypothetical protein
MWDNVALQLQRQNITFGNTVNVQGVLQDSYTSEFLIMVEGTISTVAATACIEGLPAILQKININGPLAGFGPLTPFNGLSGPMIVDASQFVRRSISYSFGSLGSTGKFAVSIPCTMINQRFRYPWSHMSVLPTSLMGAVNFNILVASQAQLDVNVSPTLDFSTLTMYVQQNEYTRESIPLMSPNVPAAQVPKGSFQFIPMSWNYAQNQNIQTAAQTQQLLPNGTYTLVLIRSFTTQVNGVPTVRQSDAGTAGPIDTSVTTSGMILQDVNQQPKVAATYYTLRKDNQDNAYDVIVVGNACYQFNNGVDRIFQPSPGPNQIPINIGTTTTGTSNPRLDFCYQQIFDTQNWLGLR